MRMRQNAPQINKVPCVSDNKEKEVVKMGRIKRYSIVGVEVERNVTCLNRQSKNWDYQVTQDQIITRKKSKTRTSSSSVTPVNIGSHDPNSKDLRKRSLLVGSTR